MCGVHCADAAEGQLRRRIPAAAAAREVKVQCGADRQSSGHSAVMYHAQGFSGCWACIFQCA
jgi:hypothetical protein